MIDLINVAIFVCAASLPTIYVLIVRSGLNHEEQITHDLIKQGHGQTDHTA